MRENYDTNAREEEKCGLVSIHANCVIHLLLHLPYPQTRQRPDCALSKMVHYLKHISYFVTATRSERIVHTPFLYTILLYPAWITKPYIAPSSERLKVGLGGLRDEGNQRVGRQAGGWFAFRLR